MCEDRDCVHEKCPYPNKACCPLPKRESSIPSTDLLGFLFDGAAYVGIHKNAAGRITLVVNHGDGSLRTSCSKKGWSYTEKLIECRNRLSEPNVEVTGR